MQRARRLASVAVITAMAVAGLSACRSEPDVAAYMESGNITVQRVQQVYDDARDKHNRDQASEAAGASAAPSPGTAPEKLPLTGEAVLNTLVSHDVLTRLAQRHNVQLPNPLPLQDYANVLKLPADSEYVRMYVEVEGLQFVLNQAGTPATLTEADIQDIYQRIKAQNALDPSTTPQQFAASLSEDGKKTLGTAITIRDEVRADLNQQRVRLNPRYGTFDLPVLTQRGQDGSALILVATPVGTQAGSAPVQDVS
jgi:hypothetical protein